MSSYSQVHFGKIYEQYRNSVPDVYTFFFKKDDYYAVVDESQSTDDEIYYSELGYSTTCGEAIELLDSYGYTVEFFGEVLDFFKKDLMTETRDWLKNMHKNSKQSANFEQEIEQYLSTKPPKSHTDELHSFINVLKLFIQSDFKEPPFNLPYKYGYSLPAKYGIREEEASIYFDMFKSIGYIEVEKLRDYILQNYEMFPYWIISILILFEPQYFYAYNEFPEITSFMWARLLLEVSEPDEKFTLDIADVFDIDDEPQRYLESLHFDMAQNIVQKINMYNKVFNALFKNDEDMRNQYIKSKCTELLNTCDSAKTNYLKGKALEDLTEVLFTSNNFLTLVDKRVSTGDEEIDLVIRNNIDRPFWLAFQSPLFFVECKNWENRVGAKELRDFEGKLNNHQKLTKVGFFICLAGFTSEVISELKRGSRNNQHIILIERSDIEEFSSSKIDFFAWLENKASKFY